MAYTEIDDPSAYFQTALHTGNGGTQSITNDGNSDLQPDFVWIKGRSTNSHHALFDSVRSATKRLSSSENNAETTESTGLTSFNSDGWSTGAWSGSNSNTQTYVSWQWKESTVAGFDIVSYTGNGSNRTISHSLSAVPSMMIVKNRDAAEEWTVYHAGNTSAPATDYLALNTNGATTDSNTRWNDTAPTSSVFTVGTSGVVNANGQKFIAYLFSEKKGFSNAFSYSGNGNSNGSYIHLGFRASFIMVKRTDSSGDWQLVDNKRLGYNVDNNALFPNLDNTEDTGDVVDILSNGFKIRSATGTWNASGGSYIGFAFAEFPFVTSTAIPTTAR